MFRAKDLKSGRWRYGNYIYLLHENNRESHFIQEVNATWYAEPEYQRGWSHDKYEIDPETLGMDTGVKDENDKPIYGSIEYKPGKMSKGGDQVKYNIGTSDNPRYETEKMTIFLAHSVYWNGLLSIDGVRQVEIIGPACD